MGEQFTTLVAKADFEFLRKRKKTTLRHRVFRSCSAVMGIFPLYLNRACCDYILFSNTLTEYQRCFALTLSPLFWLP